MSIEAFCNGVSVAIEAYGATAGHGAYIYGGAAISAVGFAPGVVAGAALEGGAGIAAIPGAPQIGELACDIGLTGIAKGLAEAAEKGQGATLSQPIDAQWDKQGGYYGRMSDAEIAEATNYFTCGLTTSPFPDPSTFSEFTGSADPEPSSIPTINMSDRGMSPPEISPPDPSPAEPSPPSPSPPDPSPPDPSGDIGGPGIGFGLP